MKRIRTRSTPNVETERLLGRLDYIRACLRQLLRACEQKEHLRQLARECVNIERELTRRDVPFLPVTDATHLGIDVNKVVLIGPKPARVKS